MRLRPARPEDGRAIAEVQRTTWAATYTPWIPDAVAAYDVERSAANWADAATREGRHVTVAVDGDDTVIGFAASGPAINDDEAGSGAVYAIYVHPERHSLGIGQALMADAMSWLADAGYPECVLWVAEPSIRSRRFYEQVGFTWDESAKDEWRGLAIVRYRHPLG